MWKLRVGVEHYYLSQVARGLDDYYTGRGEAAGRWLGVASSGLGLERGDEVTVDALQAVLAGLRPGTGLTPNGTQLRTWRNRVPGFDLTFSAPKSVSALYALADPLVAGQVVEACDAAVEAALSWLEREACFVRRGSNNRAATPGTPSGEWGTRRLSGAGLVAAGFRHRTSRAGDPQLHTHVLVANITRGPDQRWTALDGQAIYRSKHAAGSVYQTVLRDELTHRLGVNWGPVHKGSAEIAGIPRRLLRLWSKRRNEIEAELEATGQSGPAAADDAALTTRPSKEHTDITTLRERWLDEADAVGFGPDNIDQLLGHVTPQTDEHSLVDLDDSEGNRSGETLIMRVAAAMTQVDSTCTRHQITEAVAASIPHGMSVAALERITNWVLAQPELVPITTIDDPHSRSAGWEQRWTTRTLLAMEHDLIATYTDATRSIILDQELVESHIAATGSLGSDQADAVRKIALHGRGVDVIVGRAGTGKTYAMNTIRQLFEHAGYTVIGAAPSARAARELADGAGLDASTFPRFRNHQRDQLSAGHVVVIDEAGMASTPDLHDLVTTARHAGAKVILVGDHHQLPEVNAGGGFATAVQLAGDHTAELTVNRRQIQAWEHNALAELRHGHVLTGFRAYVDHDCVVLHERTGDVHHAAVDAWLASHQAGHHAVLLAGTRNEARTLNRLARHNLADHLHGPVLELDDRHFQAGDRVVLLRNSYGHTDLDRNQPCWVDNGMIATITHVHPTGQLDIECVNGRHIRLDADYIHAGHIDHGYATTIHKAQGLTCDEMMLVGPLGLYREAVYVAMSRARHGSTIFATSRQASELADQPHTTGIPLPSEHPDNLDHDLTTAIETSRAKTFATTLAPDLTDINHLAHTTPLDQLQQRHRDIRAVTRQLVAAGHTDPTEQATRLARARTTRPRLHVGGRVNAADWDNVGTVTAIFDRTGTALVTFTCSDGTRTSTKTLHWSDLTPIDHPDPTDPTVDTDDYFSLATRELDEHTSRRHTELAAHGIAPDEPAIVAAACAARRQLVTHALAARPPDWLTWWLGQRPTDPAGADIWDTELAHLATWRDTHHIPTTTPGYGPTPTDPDDRDRWREHLDRSLTTRSWLADHTSDLPTPEAPPVDIAAVRERLRELQTLLASAPPDQTRIIADLALGGLTSADIHHALTATADIQHARRNWILEHWPYIVEHAELTRIDRRHDPLAHWPTPANPTVQALLDQLRAISTDTPEPCSLLELDAEINATNPHHLLAELAERQHACKENIDALVVERNGAGRSSGALIDQHLHRLREQLAQLEAEWRTHDTAIALWDIGSRPRHLQDAVIRRVNHLAHTAICNNDPWLVAAIDAWSRNLSGDDISHLHKLITGIAAYRERHTIAGHDPIGAAPTDPSHLDAWHRLHEQLEVPHPRRPAGTALIEPASR